MGDVSPLDIFTNIPVSDGRIREAERKRVPMQGTLAATGNISSSITIDGTNIGSDELVALFDSDLGVEYSIYANNTNTGLAADKSQCVQNSASLFSEVELQIGGTRVETTRNPGKVTHAKRLLEQTADAIRGQGPSIGYYPQESPVAVTLAADATAPSDGMMGRCVRAGNADGRKYTRIPLRDLFGFCAVEKYIAGCRITLKLKPETAMEKIILRGAGSTAAYVRIHDCYLNIKIVKPDAPVLIDILNKVSAGKTMPFEYEHWEHNQYDIANGATGFSQNLNNDDNRPLAVIAFMQPQTSDSSFTVDKLAGSLYQLASHQLKIDNKVFPWEQHDGKTRGYVLEYEDFLQVGNKHRQDILGTYVDFDKWKDIYPFVAYDLSALRDPYNTARDYAARLSLKMSFTATEAAFLHVFTVSKHYVEVNVYSQHAVPTVMDFKD